MKTFLSQMKAICTIAFLSLCTSLPAQPSFVWHPSTPGGSGFEQVGNLAIVGEWDYRHRSLSQVSGWESPLMPLECSFSAQSCNPSLQGAMPGTALQNQPTAQFTSHPSSKQARKKQKRQAWYSAVFGTSALDVFDNF